MDPETGTQDYGLRIYNSNYGMFLSVDPISREYPWNSTYAFAEDRPIDGIDIDGGEFLKAAQDLNQGLITKLEKTNTNKTALYALKMWRGLANSTVEGQINTMVKTTKDQIDYVKKHPEHSKQLIKEVVGETIKTPEQKMGEGLVAMVKGVVNGDPDAVGAAVGTLIQGVAFRVGMPKAAAPTTTVETLERFANQAVKNVGEGKGPVYGTKVHSEFAKIIDNSGLNMSTEVSYLKGKVVPYGTKGAVRLDVVVGDINNPTAIFDLKTGGAQLTAARISEIRANLPKSAQGVSIEQIKPSQK